jgi:signal transduction histidine kinase
MILPPSPTDEELRLAALTSYGILDTPPEESFDRVAHIASAICQTPIALVTMVDRDRQWFKARVNFEVLETARDVAFCAHAVASGETMVVEDAAHDPRFAGNPLVLSAPNIRFYAGAPIRTGEGHSLGTLCVIDQVPRRLSAEQRSGLEALSRELSALLELRRINRELAELRGYQEQLTAMLVHDLRSPLTHLVSSGHYVLDLPGLPADATEVVAEMMTAAESIHRMTGNLLSLAQSERGELVPLRVAVELPQLLGAIEQSLSRSAAANDQTVALRPVPPVTLTSDPELLGRLLMNLGENALKYAPGGTAVTLAAEAEGDRVRLRVADRGRGVPPADRERIFDPYVRLDAGRTSGREGYGLGLAFCKVAAHALGGRIWVEDNQPSGAVFVVELPVEPAG